MSVSAFDGQWIDRDHIEIPAVAESVGIIGDGTRVIDATDPLWDAWVEYLRQRQHARPDR